MYILNIQLCKEILWFGVQKLSEAERNGFLHIFDIRSAKIK